MGLLIKTYANLVNVWKTSGEAGKQRVKGKKKWRACKKKTGYKEKTPVSQIMGNFCAGLRPF